MCAKSRLKECCHQGLPTIARVVLTRRPYIMVRAPPDLRPAVNRFSIHEIGPEIMPSRGCEGGRDGWQARRRRRSRHGSFLPTKPVYEARTQAWGNGNLDRRATGLGCEY